MPSPEPSSGPRFNDEELSLILEQAAGRHAAHGGSEGRGYTLAEIQQIAGEAGIAPGHVAAAAAQVAGRRARAGVPSARPGVFQLEHLVHGGIGADARADLVDAMRVETGLPGAVSDELGDVQWTATNEIVTTRLALRTRQGDTRIQITTDASDARILSWVGAVIVTLFAGLLLTLTLRGIGIDRGMALLSGAGLWVGSALAGGHLAWRTVSARLEARTRRIAARIAEIAEDASRPSGSDEPRSRALPARDSDSESE